MEKKIEVLKKSLNELVDKDNLNSEVVLDLSTELDKLIVEYYEMDKNEEIEV